MHVAPAAGGEGGGGRGHQPQHRLHGGEPVKGGGTHPRRGGREGRGGDTSHDTGYGGGMGGSGGSTSHNTGCRRGRRGGHQPRHCFVMLMGEARPAGGTWA